MRAGNFTGSLQLVQNAGKASFYNSRIGKFTQPDTIIPGAGNPQAFNRYAYVLNNPVNFVDPSGHAPICLDEWCRDVPGERISKTELGGAGKTQTPTISIPDVSGLKIQPDAETLAYIIGLRGLSPEDLLLTLWQDPLNGQANGGRFGENRGVNPNDAFCSNCNRYHMGIDAGAAEGTAVFAGALGIVVGIGACAGPQNTNCPDLGNFIIVEHNVNGELFYSEYAHLSTISVDLGQLVSPSTQIGEVGNTGPPNSNFKNHLHFSIRKSGNVTLSRTNPLGGNRYWGYDKTWTNDYVNLGRIYGYSPNYFGSPVDVSNP